MFSAFFSFFYHKKRGEHGWHREHPKGYVGPKSLKTPRKMKHFRRAERAVFLTSFWCLKTLEIRRNIKPFGGLSKAWACQAQPGLTSRPSPQPGRPN